MWGVLIFLPLLALTIYIVIYSIKEKKYEKNQKDRLINCAVKMLKEGTDYHRKEEIKADFIAYDFSDIEAPMAEFTLVSDTGRFPFEAKEGKLIRYREKHDMNL